MEARQEVRQKEQEPADAKEPAADTHSLYQPAVIVADCSAAPRCIPSDGSISVKIVVDMKIRVLLVP
jgi:hypothetical protein